MMGIEEAVDVALAFDATRKFRLSFGTGVCITAGGCVPSLFGVTSPKAGLFTLSLSSPLPIDFKLFVKRWRREEFRGGNPLLRRNDGTPIEDALLALAKEHLLNFGVACGKQGSGEFSLFIF